MSISNNEIVQNSKSQPKKLSFLWPIKVAQYYSYCTCIWNACAQWSLFFMAQCNDLPVYVIMFKSFSDSEIIVAGGQVNNNTNSFISNLVEKYNVQTGNWCHLVFLPFLTSHPRALVLSFNLGSLTCHYWSLTQDFQLLVFSQISFPHGPEYPVGAMSNF